MYKEDYYFVDRFYSSAFHGNWRTASCKAHTNFADESACLMGNTFGIK
jgi:hypothetical protein